MPAFPFQPPLPPRRRLDGAVWIVIATIVLLVIAAVLLATYY